MAKEIQTTIGQVVIELIGPQAASSVWPAKAWAGELVPFRANIFKESRESLAATLNLVDPSGAQNSIKLDGPLPGLDEWHGNFAPTSVGEWSFRFSAWVSPWNDWLRVAKIKVPLGLELPLLLDSAIAIVQRTLVNAPGSKRLLSLFSELTETDKPISERLEQAIAPGRELPAELDLLRDSFTESQEWKLRVERQRAGVGSWYEFFPRSEGAKLKKNGEYSSGTFKTAAKRLPEIAAMGFDVVYLPPIHPIGETNRKGRNNSLAAKPGDPGSPWAIGSSEGGHDAIHPELGNEADFQKFVETASSLGLEIALDLALQCSPDHPWVKEHPEWFSKRIDGSIAFAENPPKKYEDIYPLNFDNDSGGLWKEIYSFVEHWINLGIKVFRVDNPHTKPLRFWEWFIAKLHSEHPEVVLLAEAFTRPAPMAALAKVGFQQSYTYFTWRNTKQELSEYLYELSRESSDYLRPNLFVNTPDILSEYLQFGGRPAFKIRAAIAATGSPTWGVYSGFELIENIARPGSEENIDNEKYEFKPRDWNNAAKFGNSLAPYLTKLNQIRLTHPCLRQLRNLTVHWSDDDSILVFSKFLAANPGEERDPDAIIVVANLDPHSVRETTVHLDLASLGLNLNVSFEVTDLLTDSTFQWSADNYVRLDPFVEPVHILQVKFPNTRGIAFAGDSSASPEIG